jgi:lysophospholipase L1-like esterase
MPIPPENPDTQTILLVGDSLAAGFGVDERADRFGDLLDDRLEDQYAVYLVARPGWETQTQFANLQAYPVPPDVVIVSYFVNDVTEAYSDFHDVPPPHDVNNLFVNRLFVPSFLYWNVFLRLDAEDDPVLGAQRDPAVLAAHADEIREMVNWVREQDATVIYLIWPHPVVMEGHAPLLDTVRATLDELDVLYVDMEPEMRPYPIRERIATIYDPHPSVEMHWIAAASLWNLMVDNGLVTGD